MALTHSVCWTCSREIHINKDFHCDKHDHPSQRWFNDQGQLCIGGREHIPFPVRVRDVLHLAGKRKETMKIYSEAEIRAAWERAFHGKITPGALFKELEGETQMKDTDTVTVKEIRAAWQRIDRLEAVGSVTANELLTDILINREPEYPIGTVVRDRDRIHWYRTSGNQWYQFGSSMKFTDEAPKRPLTVVSVK